MKLWVARNEGCYDEEDEDLRIYDNPGLIGRVE